MRFESDMKNIEDLLEKLRRIMEKMRQIVEEEAGEYDAGIKDATGSLGNGFGITFLILVIIILFFAVGGTK